MCYTCMVKHDNFQAAYLHAKISHPGVKFSLYTTVESKVQAVHFNVLPSSIPKGADVFLEGNKIIVRNKRHESQGRI